MTCTHTQWLKKLIEINRALENEQNQEKKHQWMTYLNGYIESLEEIEHYINMLKSI